MESLGGSPSITARLLRHGLALGALAGFATTGVLAAIALTAVVPVGWDVALLTAVAGTVVGAGIGLVSSAFAAAMYARLVGRAAPRLVTAATLATAAVAAGGCWLVASRATEWMQATWMLLVVALGAGALADVSLSRITRHERPNRRRVWPWVVGGAVVCAGLGIAGAGVAGVGPLADKLGGVSTHVPVIAAAASGDPNVLRIAVQLSDDDFCEGQVTVQTSESAETVRVTDAVNRVDRNYWAGSPCVGYGLVNGIAWVDVQLNQPLGDRAVVGTDGAQVPLSSG